MARPRSGGPVYSQDLRWTEQAVLLCFRSERRLRLSRIADGDPSHHTGEGWKPLGPSAADHEYSVELYLGVSGGDTVLGQYQIYDPYSVVIDGNGIPRRQPFCGNVIPANRLTNSAMVQLYNNLQPIPTQNNPLGSNFSYTQITPQTYRDYTGRVDYKFASKDNLFVRYTRGNYTKGQNDWTVGNAGQQQGPRWIDVPAIGWDHVFNEHTNIDVNNNPMDPNFGRVFGDGWPNSSGRWLSI